MSSSKGVPERATIARAAALLAGARQLVIAGLGTDVDGIRAALGLAAQLGAAIDHAATAHGRIELRTLADAGLMLTTAAEARHRADLVVLVGSGAVRYADHARTFGDAGGLYPWRGARQMMTVATGGERPAHAVADGGLTAFGDGLAPGRAITLIAARLKGRPLAPGQDVEAIDAAVATLKAARFGVFIVDPADVDHVDFDALHRLVKELNAETRFTTLTIPPAHHGRGANLVSAWTTGDRLPVGLGRGYPEQDDWRFDAERMVTSGEGDALLWIGALGPDLPAWAAGVPTVALLHPGAQPATADVVIEVGVPGVTHAGALTDAGHAGFTYCEARAPEALPSVAAVIAAIREALP